MRTSWAAGEEDDIEEPEEGGAWIAIARGVALLLGTLLLVALFADGRPSGAGPWWLDVHPLPRFAALGLVGIGAASLLLFAVRGVLPVVVREIALVCVGLLLAIAIKDATIYYGHVSRGDYVDGPPIAFSLHVAGCLGVVLLAIRAAPGPPGLTGTILAFIGAAATALGFPIAHVACQGTIDARQSAAVALVAGPRPFAVEAPGHLKRRIECAVELYDEGLVPAMVLSASADEQALQRMKEQAIEAGVPAEAITVAAEANTRKVLDRLAQQYPPIEGRESVVLLVSDPDHLPRLALAGRGVPVSVAPVPCQEHLQPTRSVLLHEIAALWRCYLR